jgi:hypothetical protein
MIRAICVPCGRPKKEPFLKCPRCGFLPETEYQIGRALIFSLTRTIAGVAVGRDAETLKALSAQTRAGRFYEFDPKEEQRAVDAWRFLRQESERRRARRRRAAWAVLALALAVLAIVAGFYLTGRR